MKNIIYSRKSLDTGDPLLSLALILASTASQCGMARQEQKIRPLAGRQAPAVPLHLLHTLAQRGLAKHTASQSPRVTQWWPNSQTTGTLDKARRCIPKSLSPPPPRGECSYKGPCSGAVAVQSATHGKALLPHSRGPQSGSDKSSGPAWSHRRPLPWKATPAQPSLCLVLVRRGRLLC